MTIPNRVPLVKNNEAVAYGEGAPQRALDLAVRVSSAVRSNPTRSNAWVRQSEVGERGENRYTYDFLESPAGQGPFPIPITHDPMIRFFKFERSDKGIFVTCDGDKRACEEIVQWLVGVEGWERSSPHYADYVYHPPLAEGGLHTFSIRLDNETRGIKSFEFFLRPTVDESESSKQPGGWLLNNTPKEP